MFYLLVSADGAKIVNELPTDKEKPLILWMSGGPGCSGWFGSAVDFGPFRVKDDLTFEENIFTWAKDYYLLFVDSPIGSGSFFFFLEI